VYACLFKKSDFPVELRPPAGVALQQRAHETHSVMRYQE
jgi:hypothetical protein